MFDCSLVGEVFDALGEKQHVAFDDLAKLHQLGLVRLLLVFSGVIFVMRRHDVTVIIIIINLYLCTKSYHFTWSS